MGNFKNLTRGFASNTVAPEESATDQEVYVDNSASELKALQLEALKRRIQRQNELDPEGVQMNLKDVPSAEGQAGGHPLMGVPRQSPEVPDLDPNIGIDQPQAEQPTEMDMKRAALQRLMQKKI